MEKSKSSELNRGVIIFIGLAILTIIEYILAISQLPVILLWMIAFGKAALVVWFFMHIFRLFRSEGGH
jgi:hypothetical protein